MSSDVGRYRKVFGRLWRDGRFLKLDEGERLLVLYALTGPQTNRIGLALFSIPAAAEDLSVTPTRLRKRLEKVCDVFAWSYDSAARVLYIPSWWRFNRPENGNVLKGCLNDLNEVPDSDLIDLFAANLETLPQTLTETFRQRCWERLTKRLGKPSPTQEQEQEQEPKQEAHDDATSADAATTGASEGTAALGTFGAAWAKYYRGRFVPTVADVRKASALTEDQLGRLDAAIAAFFSSSADAYFRRHRHPFALFCSQFEKILAADVGDDEPAGGRRVPGPEETERYLAQLKRPDSSSEQTR